MCLPLTSLTLSDFFGDSALLGITLWLKGIASTGATTPNFAKYSLRAYGEALGGMFLPRPPCR